MFIGTHITNTREAKAFALLSEEGIAKGVRRITAVTTESALKAMEQADLLLKEVDDASKIEVSLLEKVSFCTWVSKTFNDWKFLLSNSFIFVVVAILLL